VTRKVFLILLALVLAISVGLVACEPTEEEEEELVPALRADLYPSSVGHTDFCDLRQDGLYVTVSNSGEKKSAASTTVVEFYTSGGIKRVELSTPAIDPVTTTIIGGGNHTAEVGPFAIPDGCDCSLYFKITVDADNVVVEKDETDNSEEGRCIGEPADAEDCPDLLPVYVPASEGNYGQQYISTDDEGKLVFWVKNQGMGYAAPTTTRIIIREADAAYFLATPYIAPGQTVETEHLEVTDWGPGAGDRHLEITVDVLDWVTELSPILSPTSGRTGEDNNVVNATMVS
jgi:hypothetical protein